MFLRKIWKNWVLLRTFWGGYFRLSKYVFLICLVIITQTLKGESEGKELKAGGNWQ